MQKTIIIIAGEPSADMHASVLTQELKKLHPELYITGIGGGQMRKAGVHTFADLSQYAVIGFLEVLKHIKIFRKIFNLTLKKISELKPTAVILIDFPGFNLRLARRIKTDFPDVKIIYYISPQIWAWGKKRIKLIKEVIDKMIVVFEFEKRLYEQAGIDAEFVGHPLLDAITFVKEKKELISSLQLTQEAKIIGLLPGSRQAEVKKILPIMLKGASLLLKETSGITFILLKASNIKDELVHSFIRGYKHLPIKIVDKNTYDYLNLCSFAWVCSGTATLETAIIGVPMLIVYKTSFLTWFISRLLIELPYIGLANIVAGEKIIPEFIQFEATPKNIARCCLDFLSKDKSEQEGIQEKLRGLRQKLGTPHANKKAAQVIERIIVGKAS